MSLFAERLQTGAERYQPPISRQQAVSRDIAPRVSETVTYAAVSAAVRAADISILSDCRLTDLYRGAPLPQDVKSLTISLTFAHQPTSPTEDRAVSESEVNEALSSIRSELEKRCGAEFAGVGEGDRDCYPIEAVLSTQIGSNTASSGAQRIRIGT